MPPFLQFRLWLREGPVRERVLAGSAAAIFAVLLVLASLPLSSNDELVGAVAPGSQLGTGSFAGPPGEELADQGAVSSAAGDQPTRSGSGGTASGGRSGAVRPGSSVAARGGGAGSSSSGGAASCTGLGASAPGISAEEVLVAASIVNIAGDAGNAAFNIRPDIHEIVDAVVDEINTTGGVACGRKLVVEKYDVNPVDQNDQQRKCLQMNEANPFVVIDMAGYVRPVARSCFVQNKLPFQLSTSATQEEVTNGYPYIYGQSSTSEKQVRDGILGIAEQGFFDAPDFKKLGLLMEACSPSVNDLIMATLAEVGVQANQISPFTTSCQLIGPPSEVTQAVVQHNSDGATHAFLASSLSNNQRYTDIAAQQNFFPRYGGSDYGTLTSSATTFDPSFAGAIAETSSRRGELNSGVRNEVVKDCDRILREHGLRGLENEQGDGAALSVCDQFNFFRQAVNNAGPNPTRLSFVENGVGTMGVFTSGGGFDGVFDRPGKAVGGDFHRLLRWEGDCECWKVLEPAFERGY